MSEFYPKLTHAHLTLCASVRETESGSGQYKDVQYMTNLSRKNAVLFSLHIMSNKYGITLNIS